MKDAIEIGIKNNPDIQKSKYDIEAVKGRNLKDLSPAPLSLSLSNEFIPNGWGISNFDERTIEISQSFDFPTVYFSKNSRANAEINAVNSAYELVTNNIRTFVKRAYYSALEKQKLLKISNENFDIANEFLKKAEIRYKVGEGSNLELLTAKAQLSEAKSLIASAKYEYHEALNDLNYLLGYNSDIDFVNINFRDSLSYNKLSLSLEELTSKSIQTNPYLKKASYELESSEISKQIAWMNIIPSFNVAYMFQTRTGVSNYYGVRLGISAPLWFMFDQKGTIQEANANYQMSYYELQCIKNTIIQKINSSFIDYINDEKQFTLYQNELVPQAEEIFKTADLSYQAGEVTYLEFLQAKFTTINSKTNLIKMLYEYKIAIVNLEESTGLILE